jgi:hypothetical protein
VRCGLVAGPTDRFVASAWHFRPERNGPEMSFVGGLEGVPLERLKIIVIVILTFVVSSALTSAFWLVAFNRGAIAANDGPVPGPRAAEPERGTGGELEVGPNGLAIPVAGVKAGDLLDTFT